MTYTIYIYYIKIIYFFNIIKICDYYNNKKNKSISKKKKKKKKKKNKKKKKKKKKKKRNLFNFNSNIRTI